MGKPAYVIARLVIRYPIIIILETFKLAINQELILFLWFQCDQPTPMRLQHFTTLCYHLAGMLTKFIWVFKMNSFICNTHVVPCVLL
jgi:hypothetical protein